MSEEQEQVHVNVEREAPEVNLMQIETGSGGYGIIVVVPALMPEADFQKVISRLNYVETRLRAVKELPISESFKDDGDYDDDDDTTEIKTTG